MPDQFSLTVELGNDAMTTNGDVADLLDRLAEKFRRYASDECVAESGRMSDYNGNSVAEWEIA